MRWLYRILRPIVRIGLKVYFRKIYIHFEEAVPKSGPVLISANHPSAFMEAILMACFLERPIHYLVRGDIFKKEWAKKILALTHQIPIYRFRDGFSSMRKNHATFEKVYELLAEDKVVVIFSESFTFLEKRLRPIQKGTARIAFGAHDYIGKPFPIVPIGINYTNAMRFRSEVSIKGGKHIDFETDYQLFKKDKQAGLQSLTDKVREHLHPLIIEVAKKSDYDLAEKLFLFSRPASFYSLFPNKSRDMSAHLYADQQATGFLNNLNEEQKNKLEEQLDHMIEKSATYGLLWKVVRSIGFILHWPIIVIVQYIIKNMIRANTFVGPVKAASMTLLYGIYWVLWIILFWILGWPVWLAFIGLPIVSLITLKCMDAVYWIQGIARSRHAIQFAPISQTVSS